MIILGREIVFKHTNFVYDIKGSRSENCVLIDTDDWVVNTSNAIIGIDDRGGVSNSFISRVLKVNIHEGSKYYGLVSEGDMIMVTHTSAKVFSQRYFTIPLDWDSNHYTDIPMAHVIGKFNDGQITFTSFELLNDYVLTTTVKDVDNNGTLAVATKDSTVSVQEVVKKGSNAVDLEVGDKVLVRDNTTTSIMIEGVQYNTVNREMIVGKFRGESNEYTIGNLEALLGTYVLMIDNQSVYALEGSNILNPDYDFDTDVDSMSEVWTDRYEVLMSNIDELKVGDLVFVPREALNYVTLRGRRYFVAYDKDFMLARITK